MPLHDWTRVPAGLYHDFHQSWTIRIKDALNAGVLPQGTVALEQRSGAREADVLTVEASPTYDFEPSGGGAIETPPRARIVRQTVTERYVVVIDPFPPTPRDPFGIHKAIWDGLVDEPFELPPGKDRVLVSYNAGDKLTAYIEPIAVGDPLPDVPLFLTGDRPQNLRVDIPLERTYEATWEATPEALRVAVETGELPNPEAD